MDALAAMHDAAVQMIDTSLVRVHQHGACIAGNNQQHMGRSRGGLTTKIHAVVDTNGLPVQMGLTPGETHDNQLCSVLLSELRPQTMLLADRGYDADWVRALAATKARGQTSRPSGIAKRQSASAHISTGRVIWSSGSSTRSSSVSASQLDMTSLQPTISPSSSWHQSGYGCTLMSPRPSSSALPYAGIGHSRGSMSLPDVVQRCNLSSVIGRSRTRFPVA
jgi:transposase